MDLHGQIMNIQIDQEKFKIAIGDSVFQNGSNVAKMLEMAYKLGHRDARHDAAELALTNRQTN